MASPAPSWSGCASGGVIASGRHHLPAWRSVMAPRTWAEVPSTLLSSINPENNPAYNPAYPSSAPWHGSGGQAQVVGAWNGAVYNAATDDLYIPLAGGHTDYAGNEPYKINLRTDAPAWVMLRPPSGSVGSVINLDDGQEATGLYSDGRLRSVHSYGNHCYVPGLGPVITRVVASYRTAQGNPKKSYSISEMTGEATVLSDWAAVSNADTGGTTASACYDPSRGCIWHLGSATSKMLKTTVSTGVTVTVGVWDNHIAGYGALVYVPTLDLVCAFDGTNGLRIFDPVTGLWSYPNVTGSYSAGLDTNGQYGASWDGSKILLWDNATARTEISTLSPPAGNPRTTPWVCGVLTVSGSNAVTPSARTSSGTRERFGYSPFLKGCYLLNSVSEKLYFFATE